MWHRICFAYLARYFANKTHRLGGGKGAQGHVGRGLSETSHWKHHGTRRTYLISMYISLLDSIHTIFKFFDRCICSKQDMVDDEIQICYANDRTKTPMKKGFVEIQTVTSPIHASAIIIHIPNDTERIQCTNKNRLPLQDVRHILLQTINNHRRSTDNNFAAAEDRTLLKRKVMYLGVGLTSPASSCHKVLERCCISL